MSLAQKIKHQWGYNLGPFPPSVVLAEANGVVSIGYWPDDNPPTIAEIEAVQLPAETTPNWAAFRQSLAGSAAYLRITGHSNSTLALLPMLTNVAFLVGDNPALLLEFARLWNAIATIAQPTQSEINELNAIGTACHVPFSLSAGGLIT